MHFKFYIFIIELIGKILIFTSDFTWKVSLASEVISENLWKSFDFHK